jgi:methylated-DNA-[protein]-cysteine S-methyltransferase
MGGKAFRTGFGWMAAAATPKGIRLIVLPTTNRADAERMLPQGCCGDAALAADLKRYFSGEKVDFSEYRLDPADATGFQRRVWAAARRIPYGKTTTYGEMAASIGSPGAARAVGGALNANPFPVVVPCHRVVSSAGIGGFAAGSDLKAKMLLLER